MLLLLRLSLCLDVTTKEPNTKHVVTPQFQETVETTTKGNSMTRNG